jgi:hypothetical protein
VARKHSKKRKVIAGGAASAIISGFAGGVPPVAFNAVESALHAPAANVRANISGDGYYLSEEWQGSGSDRAAAIGMASQVVDIALRKAGCRNCDAASKRRYIQWILAGNMTSAEGAQILAQSVFQFRIKPLRELVQLIREEQSVDKRSLHPAVKATIMAAAAAATAADLMKTHRKWKRYL